VSRRDFGRLLALLVTLRAVEVARLAGASRPPEGRTVTTFGVAVPVDLAAWAFCLVTLATAVLLARAAWSRG